MSHENWLDKTIQMAIHNAENGGGPFAAIVVKNGEIIGRGVNLVHLNHDPSAHGELLAIREACAYLASTDLSDCVLYASGEPCPMCLGAAYWTTIGHIYYACSKEDAQKEAHFGNPLSNFYKDQEKEGEKRETPFIQLKTATALQPFLTWSEINNNG